ncbi:pre-mRNA-splicing helicase BRR2, putative [Plasmodium sp. DRC-Itaito]|nr:pre-mRNA-splicing helicase BRR2, putative [Plasmodium sp. DRC-Itaito]
MAEEYEKFKRFEYRMNSNLVLQREGPISNNKEPTGESESLVGRLKYKMGDKVEYNNKNIMLARDNKEMTINRNKRKDIFDDDKYNRRSNKKIRHKEKSVLNVNIEDIFLYKPTTKYTEDIYTKLMSKIRYLLGDNTGDIINSACNEILYILKNEEFNNEQKKKQVESQLEINISDDVFIEINNLSKEIYDFNKQEEGGEYVENDEGVAVIFEEDDDYFNVGRSTRGYMNDQQIMELQELSDDIEEEGISEEDNDNESEDGDSNNNINDEDDSDNNNNDDNNDDNNDNNNDDNSDDNNDDNNDENNDENNNSVIRKKKKIRNEISHLKSYDKKNKKYENYLSLKNTNKNLYYDEETNNIEDNDELNINVIDSHWLQRELNKLFPDPSLCLDKEKEVLNVLNIYDIQESENKLMHILKYENFNIARVLIKNRWKIYYCTLLGQAQTEEEKEEIKNEMKKTEEGQDILDELCNFKNVRKNKQNEFSKIIRKEVDNLLGKRKKSDYNKKGNMSNYSYIHDDDDDDDELENKEISESDDSEHNPSDGNEEKEGNQKYCSDDRVNDDDNYYESAKLYNSDTEGEDTNMKINAKGANNVKVKNGVKVNNNVKEEKEGIDGESGKEDNEYTQKSVYNNVVKFKFIDLEKLESKEKNKDIFFNKEVILPPESKRIEKKEYDEIIISSMKSNKMDDMKRIKNKKINYYTSPEDIKLIHINELPEWTHDVFSCVNINKLNPIQSKVYDVAFNKYDENMLICAPTGSGKTNIALLCILNIINSYRLKSGEIDRNGFKIVYISPMKALVNEQVQSFNLRLKCMNIKVSELTGDVNLSTKELDDSQIIVMTPEKFDVISRKWNEKILLHKIKLIIFDEIHLLNEIRGNVLESIIARINRYMDNSMVYDMRDVTDGSSVGERIKVGENKSDDKKNDDKKNDGDKNGGDTNSFRENKFGENHMSIRKKKIRLVGLSATLPNYEDVGIFLRADIEKGIFYFDQSFRPVQVEQHYIGIKEKKGIKKYALMNEITYEKVLEEAGKNQILIFVHSRKETYRTSKILIDRFMRSDNLSKFLIDKKISSEILLSEKDNVINEELKEILPFGFGIHHAGLKRLDRKLVEDLFSDRHIQVLVCTSTLAWGINLPAHTVIIKGTSVYNINIGDFDELSSMDILQMVGRSGRPQYDKSGKAIIITDHKNLQLYLSLNNEQLCIESTLLNNIINIINAEIVLKNIQNMDDAMNWLEHTYMYIRMLKYPSLYGVIMNSNDKIKSIEEFKDIVDMKNKIKKHNNNDNIKMNSIIRDNIGNNINSIIGTSVIDYISILKSNSKYNKFIEKIKRRMYNILYSCFVILEKYDLIKYNRKLNTVSSTYIGKISSYYYVDYKSVDIYNKKLNKYTNEIDLLKIFTMSDEFKNIYIRDEDKSELSVIIEKLPIPVKESIDNPYTKINILLQLYLSNVILNGYIINADMVYIHQNALRIFRSFFEISLKKNSYNLIKLTLKFCKMIERRMWSTMTPLRQFGLLSTELIRIIEKKNISFKNYLTMNLNEYITIFKNKKIAKNIYKLVHHFPKLELNAYIQPINHKILKVDLNIAPDFIYNPKYHGYFMLFWVFVFDISNEHILHYDLFTLKKNYKNDILNETYNNKYKKYNENYNSNNNMYNPSDVLDDHMMTFFLPINDNPFYIVKVVSDKWLNCEASVNLYLKDLILPSQNFYSTQLLDLQPFPVHSIKYEKAHTFFNNIRNLQYFNSIHTQIFTSVFENNGNVLIANSNSKNYLIPAELGIIRIVKFIHCLYNFIKTYIKKHKDVYKIINDKKLSDYIYNNNLIDLIKIVYIAPLDDVIIKTYKNWQTLKKIFNLKMCILTGDIQIDMKLLQTHHIILSNPSNYDNISKKWRRKKILQNVSFYIFDHMELLDTPQGGIMEILISRIRYISTQLNLNKSEKKNQHNNNNNNNNINNNDNLFMSILNMEIIQMNNQEDHDQKNIIHNNNNNKNDDFLHNVNRLQNFGIDDIYDYIGLNRILCLSSCSLYNSKDFAEWIGCKKNDYYNFLSTVRDIPIEIYLHAVNIMNKQNRYISMQRQVYQNIRKLKNMQKKKKMQNVIIFVTDQKMCKTLALDLILSAYNDNFKYFSLFENYEDDKYHTYKYSTDKHASDQYDRNNEEKEKKKGGWISNIFSYNKNDRIGSENENNDLINNNLHDGAALKNLYKSGTFSSNNLYNNNNNNNNIASEEELNKNIHNMINLNLSNMDSINHKEAGENKLNVDSNSSTIYTNEHVFDYINDKMLKQFMKKGICYLHNNMTEIEKKIVEILFDKKTIQILIVSYDYIYSLNVYANTVIILDTIITHFHNNKEEDYSIQNILEMISYAGRQNEDTKSFVYIYTYITKKEYYKNFIYEPLTVESNIEDNLPNFLNNEIVMSTIENYQDAIDWLTWSFFYRRIKKNPNYYGLNGISNEHISDYLSEIIENNMEILSFANCINIEETMDIKPCNLGIISSFYNLDYHIIHFFNQYILSLKTLKKSRIFEIICLSNIFNDILKIHNYDIYLCLKIAQACNIQVTYEFLKLSINNENTLKNENLEDNINKDMKSEEYKKDQYINLLQFMTVPIYFTSHLKAFILLQAHIHRYSLPVNYIQETKTVLLKAYKLINSLIDVISSNNILNFCLFVMEVSQMLTQSMKSTDQSNLYQLPHFDEKLIKKANDLEILDVYDLINAEDEPRDILLKHLNEKQRSEIANVCNIFPIIDVKYEIDLDKSYKVNEIAQLNLTIERDLTDDAVIFAHSLYLPFEKEEMWWIVIGIKKMNLLLSIKKLSLLKSLNNIKINFELPDKPNTYDVVIYVINDCYVGCDQEYEFKISVEE